jgi:hypothetical protein
MRLTGYTALFLLCCHSFWAADAAESPWRISILASEISTANNEFSTDDPHGGLGVGLAYAPNAQWDAELTVSSQTHVSPSQISVYTPTTPGAPGVIYSSFEFRRYRVAPIDLTATRHFLPEQTISPYVRAGLRYVQAPDDKASRFPFFVPSDNVPPGTIQVPYYPISTPNDGFNFSDRTSAQVGAGVKVRLTPRTAIRAEANRLLRSGEVDFDPLLRYAVGLSFMF